MLIRTAKYIGWRTVFANINCWWSISSSSIAKCNTEETKNSGMLLFNNDTMFPVLLFARRQATPRQHWFFNCGQWCRCDFSLRYGVCSHSYVLPGDRPHDLGYFIVPFLALSVWRWIVRSCCFPALDIIRLLANSWDRIKRWRKRPDQCSWMELWLFSQSTFLSSVRGRRWTLERWMGKTCLGRIWCEGEISRNPNNWRTMFQVLLLTPKFK